ncbi:6354_t:CDS:2, partial [Acaulospora colombiana]
LRELTELLPTASRKQLNTVKSSSRFPPLPERLLPPTTLSLFGSSRNLIYLYPLTHLQMGVFAVWTDPPDNLFLPIPTKEFGPGGTQQSNVERDVHTAVHLSSLMGRVGGFAGKIVCADCRTCKEAGSSRLVAPTLTHQLSKTGNNHVQDEPKVGLCSEEGRAG